jgi:hypothetical protein
MRYYDLMLSKDPAGLPQINKNAFRILWCDDWYDGPISGLLLYQDRRYLFATFDELDDGTRRLFVFEPSKEELRQEEDWHRLFVQKVGSHYTYLDAKGIECTPEQWREFYDVYEKRAKPDYSDNSVIGWFEFRSTQELQFGLGGGSNCKAAM